MSEFVFHPDAVKDMEEVREYIAAADNLDGAGRVREDIFGTIQSLVPFPYVGHTRPVKQPGDDCGNDSARGSSPRSSSVAHRSRPFRDVEQDQKNRALACRVPWLQQER